MKSIFKDKKFVIIIVLIIFMLGGIFYYVKNDNKVSEDVVLVTKKVSSTKVSNKKMYVDIKGSVKNPGVYEFKENDRVIDAINYAGGLNKYANTSNINLSQKLSSEMVIYVFSNKEIEDGSKASSCSTICGVNVIEVNNCVDENNSSDKVNINNATLEELMTLTGIGESKAKNIIAYREKEKFKTIEDIKNISGIGDVLFEKIKDRIVV